MSRRPAPYAAPDTGAMREMAATMQLQLENLHKMADTMANQSTQLVTLAPQMEAAEDIHKFRRQIRAQEKKGDLRVAQVTHHIKEILKEQIAEILKEEIAATIAEEVRVQVADHVRSQLGEKDLLGLPDQTNDSHARLQSVYVNLKNSEARRANGKLRASSLYDRIMPIQMSSGHTSGHWPGDLKTLFGLDDNTIVALLGDYNLPASDSREVNLNKLMALAGINFQLIPLQSTMTGAEAASRLGVAL